MEWPSLTTSPSWSFSVSSFAQRGQMTRSNILVEQKRNFFEHTACDIPPNFNCKVEQDLLPRPLSSPSYPSYSDDRLDFDIQVSFA